MGHTSHAKRSKRGPKINGRGALPRAEQHEAPLARPAISLVPPPSDEPLVAKSVEDLVVREPKQSGVQEPKQSNGSSPSVLALLKLPIGATIGIEDSDAQGVRAAFRTVEQAQHRLGVLRAEFLEAERGVCNSLAEAIAAYREVVKGAGVKNRLNLGEGSSEAWRYDLETAVFTRTA